MAYTPPVNPASWHTPTAGKLGQQDDQQPHPPGSHPDGHRQVLSPDEVRVLKECNTESFYYRCVPLTTLLSGLAYVGMKNGYIKKSPSYGYAPKMMLGAILGYIGGKISYQSVCAEKIMRLPNSRLGDVLRKRKGLSNYQESSTEPGFSLTSPSAEFQHDNTIYDERRPDLSEHAEGSDSYHKVQENLSPYSDRDQSAPNRFTSYEDLRRDNREEYASKLSEKYKRENGLYRSPNSSPPSSYSEPPFSSNESPADRSTTTGPTKREPYFNPKKNKYGDLWDD